MSIAGLRILAIDTTSDFGSLALIEDDRIRAEVPVEGREGFGHTLFGHIDDLLREHEWPVSSIHCFAAASGPGSFTGVRVGLTAVKGLAEANRGRAIGVSNLQALAFYGTTSKRAVWIDARRGDVYGSIYDDLLSAIVPEAVLPFSIWQSALPQDVTEAITPLFESFAPQWERPNVPVSEQRSLAGAVGCIAAKRIREESGLTLDDVLNGNAVLDANYVRRSDAELFWRDTKSPAQA